MGTQDAAATVGVSATARQAIVGRCSLGCGTPWQDLSGNCVCCVCKKPVVVCRRCDLKPRNADLYCRRHEPLRGLFCTRLERFSAAELRAQLQGLEVLAAALLARHERKGQERHGRAREHKHEQKHEHENELELEHEHENEHEQEDEDEDEDEDEQGGDAASGADQTAPLGASFDVPRVARHHRARVWAELQRRRAKCSSHNGAAAPSKAASLCTSTSSSPTATAAPGEMQERWCRFCLIDESKHSGPLGTCWGMWEAHRIKAELQQEHGISVNEAVARASAQRQQRQQHRARTKQQAAHEFAEARARKAKLAAEKYKRKAAKKARKRTRRGLVPR